MHRRSGSIAHGHWASVWSFSFSSARIVMLAANGMQNKNIVLEVWLYRRQVALWRERFLERGVEPPRKDAPAFARLPSS